MQILVDFLTFSDRSERFDFWLDFFEFNLDEFEDIAPARGWFYHKYFGGIHVYYGGREDIGFEFSGRGCRSLESLHKLSFDWLNFFRLLFDMNIHISRLDIACDETEGILNFDKLVMATAAHKYVSRARRRVYSQGDERNIIFGSPQSDTRLRIYDKALERSNALHDGSISDEHWIRVEMQMRNEAAMSFVRNLVTGGYDIGACFLGCPVKLSQVHDSRSGLEQQ